MERAGHGVLTNLTNTARSDTERVSQFECPADPINPIEAPYVARVGGRLILFIVG
jgi:hypothetical protein